jgi:two-component system sensor histidine kinase TctE
MLARYAEGASDRAYDQLLLASALTIADATQIEEGQATVDLPYASLAILATGRRDRVFYRVAAPDGALVTGYPDLAPALPLARSQEPLFADVSYRGADARVVRLGRFVATAGGGSSWITIVVAHTREERAALAADILAHAFLPVVLTVLAATALIWFGVRRALAPLGVIERHLRRREPTDLSPVELPVPSEVRQLLSALNRLMQRLQANLRLMQAFLADAAHQIRTPLATLRAQADLAVEEDDVATLRSYVHKIHRNAALASQVTNQLLSHAMVVHRGQLAARDAVDPVALLRQVAQRAEAGGNGPPIELDLRELEGAAVIVGDPVALTEAFANLIDNARKYAGDQSPVRIGVAAAANTCTLRIDVADRGPGIPDSEKGRVVERFSRGRNGHGVAGSGLGLAIVKAVADAHGAGFALLDRPGGGLLVRLEFPLSTRSAMPPPPPVRATGRLLALLAAALLGCPPARAAESVLYPAPAPEQGRLLIHAATDRSAMEPLLRDFQAANPAITIRYVDLSTNELFASVVDPSDGTAPDLAISSAMDLQVKLVNDGWTQRHVSGLTARLPAWAKWRDEAFGFTLEPAVIVHRRGALAAAEVPRSRPALIRLLQGQPDRFRRRVATYDIAASGVGYLFAAQDSVLSGQFWRLVLALGDVDVRLLPTSAEMLDALKRGEVLIGYNVLGSYARAEAMAGAPVEVVLPEDYTLVLSRVATIPKAAAHPGPAKRFLDYLLSDRGQGVVGGPSHLQAIVPPDAGSVEAAWPLADAHGPIHPVTLGPPLLVFLDPLKKERFLASWSSTIHRP